MNWYKNLKIRAKMLVGFFVVIALMIALSVFANIKVRSVDELNTYSSQFPGKREKVIMQFQSETNDLRRIMASITMYIPSNDVTKTEPLIVDAKKALSTLPTRLDEYENLVMSDPHFTQTERDMQLKMTGDLRTVVHRYETEIIDAITVHARGGEYEKAIDTITVGASIIKDLTDEVKHLTEYAQIAADDSNIEATATANGAVSFIISISVVAALVAGVIAFYVASLISKPVISLVDAAESIAKGDLNVNINVATKDEIGMLAQKIKAVISVINKLVSDLNFMADSVDRVGDFEVQIDSSQFSGSYREVAEGVNNLTGGILNDIVGFLECVQKFGDGDFKADVPQLPGKKVIMNEAINNLRRNMMNIVGDIGALAKNAIDGKLSARVDVSAYSGDWVALMTELNRLMEAIIAPINEASEVLGYVSEGNFNRKMTGEYKGDFLVIKESINTTVGNIASYIEEISGVLGALAEDDLDQDIRREYVGKFSEIKDALLNIISKFNTVISSIASASEQVASGARMISESSMGLAAGATEQASSVEELNATIQTINEETMKNAANAKNANRLSAELKQAAEMGNVDMGYMLNSMNEIKESSGKISRIIKVIEDIAFQTNLLALNAAVEAARAGSHGKGFSVVADEVRSLSQKTSVSAKETAELIEESIEKVNDGTAAAGKTGEALKAIVTETEKVVDIVTHISESSEEQAAAIGQVMSGISQITDVVQSNSASAEESASASQELASQSDVLKGMIDVFKLKRA